MNKLMQIITDSYNIINMTSCFLTQLINIMKFIISIEFLKIGKMLLYSVLTKGVQFAA